MHKLHQTKKSQNVELNEIDEGIRLHTTWAQKVFQYLVLRTPAEPEFSAKESHLLCNFGKWFQLNHTKFEKIDSGKTQELEQAHYLVHDHLYRICSFLNDHQQVDADLVVNIKKVSMICWNF